ncbi:hypothetical protein BN2537_13717 [Streptomyces venezuelae]|nr:hypothetical protein BN2537_13717 [Streptomyces venezuelae]
MERGRWGRPSGESGTLRADQAGATDRRPGDPGTTSRCRGTAVPFLPVAALSPRPPVMCAPSWSGQAPPGARGSP